MEYTYEKFTVVGEGLTVSLLVWRRFRRPMPLIVEETYRVNPGLADLGSFIPLGTVVNLPIPAPQPFKVVTPVRLWG